MPRSTRAVTTMQPTKTRMSLRRLTHADPSVTILLPVQLMRVPIV